MNKKKISIVIISILAFIIIINIIIKIIVITTNDTIIFKYSIFSKLNLRLFLLLELIKISPI